MKITQVFVSWLFLLAVATKANAQTYNVSPGGNSLDDAKAWVAANAPGMNQDLVVNLANGVYQRSSPFTLNASHSGRNGHRVIWRATTENGARINGGRRVTGWQTTPDGLWKATVSGAAPFRHLWSGSTQGVRARHPNKGKRYTLKRWVLDDKTIVINSNEIKRWKNLDKVEMVVQKWWAESRFLVTDFTISGAEAKIIPTSDQQSLEWAFGFPARMPQQAYYFENALELLDAEGEWYFDDNNDVLYYKPRAGESINSTAIWIEQADQLVSIDGTDNTTFDGITFEYSRWGFPNTNGLRNGQAGFYSSFDSRGNPNQYTVMPSSIYIKNSDNLIFKRNIFRRFGRGGIELTYGTTNTLFEGNVFDDIAGNGVLVFNWLRESTTKPIGFPNTAVPPDKYCLDDKFVDNYFVRNGTTYQGAVSVVGFYPKGMIVDNNEIVQSPYSGISMGMGFTFETTILSDNKMRRNYIHDIMYRNSDGGGIYTLSEQQGTVISENFVENLIESAYTEDNKIRGFYLDQASGGITLANNVGKNIAGELIREQTNAGGTGINFILGNSNSNPTVEANAGITASYQYIRNKVPAAINPGEGTRVTAATDPPPGSNPITEFIPDPNKWYRIYSEKRPSRALHDGDEAYSQNSSGSYIISFPYNSSFDAQRWKIISTDDGWYRFFSEKNTGRALHESNEIYSSNAQGTHVINFTHNSTFVSQKWKIQETGDGWNRIYSEKTPTKSLHDADEVYASNANGNYIIVFPSSLNSSAQKWKFQEVAGPVTTSLLMSRSEFNQDEKLIEQTRFFPNPNDGILHIRSNAHSFINYEILNFSGQQVLQGKLIETTDLIEIDVSTLTKGSYLLRLEDMGGNIKTEKIIKN